jgi:hypothetical protein
MIDAPVPPEQPPYGTPTVYAITPSARNSLATAALVVGIVSAFFGLFVPIPLLGLFSAFLAAPLGIFAVGLGFPALSRAKVLRVGRGAAIAGIILGFVALGISIIVTVGWIVFALVAEPTATPTPTPF